MQYLVELPWPPNVNHYRTPMGNRLILTTAARDYHAKGVLACGRCADWPLLEPLSVELEACAPDRRRRDLDGLFKVTLDTLTRARVWKDDSQAHRLLGEWGPIAPGGRIRVRIEPMAEWLQRQPPRI